MSQIAAATIASATANARQSGMRTYRVPKSAVPARTVNSQARQSAAW